MSRYSAMSAACGTMEHGTHRDHPGEQAAQDPIRLLAIRDTPLSVDEVFAAVGDDAAGGTTLFVGTVRDHDGGRRRRRARLLLRTRAPRRSCAGSPRRSRAEYPVRALAAVHRVGDLRGRRPRGGRRRVLPAPRRGLRGLPDADRRPQARGADLEAPDVRRRHRGVGRRLLSAARPAAGRVADASGRCGGGGCVTPAPVP